MEAVDTISFMQKFNINLKTDRNRVSPRHDRDLDLNSARIKVDAILVC